MNPNRINTYSIVAPVSTYTRPATCAEVDCAAHLNGWVTKVDTSSALGRRQADYLAVCGRHYAVNRLPGGIVEYTFPPGQECFAAHRALLERDPLYLVRRGAPGRYVGSSRTHDTPAHWVEDFATNQDRLATLIGE